MEEKRSNLDGNVDEIAKELQRMEGKKQYLEEEKTDLSEALDRQRHIFESKVIEQGKYLYVTVFSFIVSYCYKILLRRSNKYTVYVSPFSK